MPDIHQSIKRAANAAMSMKEAADLLKSLRFEDGDDNLDDATNLLDDAAVYLNAYLAELRRVSDREDDAAMYGPKMIPRHRGFLGRLTEEE